MSLAAQKSSEVVWMIASNDGSDFTASSNACSLAMSSTMMKESFAGGISECAFLICSPLALD